MSDNPLIGCVSAVARLNEVFLQFRFAVVVVSLIFRVVRELREVLAVPVTHAIVPAVIAMLFIEAVVQHCVVCTVGIRFNLFNSRKRCAGLADCHSKSAAVVAVVSFRIDCKDDLIACLDFIGLVECHCSVFTEVALDRAAHPLLLNTVDEDAYGCTVGSRICAVGELDIFTGNIDRAVLCDNPLVGCVSAVARFDEVFLQLRLAVVVVSLIFRVVRELREVLAVPVTEAIVPAVIALLFIEAVEQNRVVCTVGIRFDFFNFRQCLAFIAEDDGKTSGIPGIVIVR